MPGRRCAVPFYPTSGTGCRARRKHSWAPRSTSSAERSRTWAAARGRRGATWRRRASRGDAGGLALNGDVVTGTAGLDRQWRAVLVGLALSRSSGEGGYGTGAGTIASTLTSVHSVRASPAWGACAGVGRGGLGPVADSRSRRRAGAALEADLRNSMAAAGARAVLMGAGGLEIALRFRLPMDGDVLGRGPPHWRRRWARRAAGG